MRLGLSGVWMLLFGIGGGTAMAEVPNVATDIPPVQSLAARVMAGLGEPELIIRPGASPHGYALRPSEAAALQRADVVFYVSSDLTPWLERMSSPLSDQAEIVELQALPGGVQHEGRHRALFEAHEEDHDHHDADHDDGDSHDHDGHDPHGWLDPENGKLWLFAMAEVLAAQDPENAETYRRNAIAGGAEIDAAIADARAMLKPVKEAKFVVFHDAYQYFEHRFGLHSVGAISLSDASAPGPKRVAEIRDAVRAMGVSCVFSEPQFNPGLVRTVFEGGSARTAVLDPLGVELTPGVGLYPALIRGLADEMARCLGAQ